MTVTVLTQGDDLNALGDETNIILKTDIDLTGFKAVFQLGDYQQKFDDITSKKLPLVIPKEETEKLKCGPQKGGLKIYDKNGLAKTVFKDVKFLIEPEVVKNV